MNTTTAQTSSTKSDEDKLIALADLTKSLPDGTKDTALGQALLKAVDKVTAPKKAGGKPGPKPGVARAPKPDGVAAAAAGAARLASEQVNITTEGAKLDPTMSHADLVDRVAILMADVAIIGNKANQAESKATQALGNVEALGDSINNMRGEIEDARVLARQMLSKEQVVVKKNPMWVKALAAAASVATVASGMVYILSERRKNNTAVDVSSAT